MPALPRSRNLLEKRGLAAVPLPPRPPGDIRACPDEAPRVRPAGCCLPEALPGRPALLALARGQGPERPRSPRAPDGLCFTRRLIPFI